MRGPLLLLLVLSVAAATACQPPLPESGAFDGRPWKTDSELDALKVEMTEIARALGERCDACHAVERGFEHETERKQIARLMMRRFTRSLELADTAGRVRCGHCHDGAAKILGDRGDRDRINKIMSGYTERFRKVGGRKITCDTCHVGIDGRPARRFLPRVLLPSLAPEPSGF